MMTDRAAYMRAYRRRTAGQRCGRCSFPAVMPGLRQCAMCSAVRAEGKPWLFGLEHDTRAHAAMLWKSRQPTARCAVLGLTLAELELVGQVLQVDRIREREGYTRPNMQLLAAKLNRAKRDGTARMHAAAAWLREQVSLVATGDPRDLALAARRSMLGG
jgi:hypothetical protein